MLELIYLAMLLLSVLVLIAQLMRHGFKRRVRRPSRPVRLAKDCRVEALRFLNEATLHRRVRFVGPEWNHDIVHSIGVREKFDSLEFDTDYMGSQFQLPQIRLVEDGYYHVVRKKGRGEKLSVLPELAKCCQELKEFVPMLLDRPFFTSLGENMLVKLRILRPSATITLYVPNRIESEEAAFKLLHFLSHIESTSVSFHSVAMKDCDLNRALMMELRQRLGIAFTAKELCATGAEIPHLLNGRSIVGTVEECRFDHVEIDDEVLGLIGGGRRHCTEQLKLDVVHNEVEERGVAERHHPIERVTEHLQSTLPNLRLMVPEVVIVKQHSIKEFEEGEIPWRWPRVAFPRAEARHVGRHGFYLEARHVFSFVRRNEHSGGKFLVSVEVQDGRLLADGTRTGEEVLNATFKRVDGRSGDGESGKDENELETEELEPEEFEVLRVFGNARNRL